ncbi:MAG: AbiV family abortive infection protein, partial [Cyanobacteria bacterium REEB65]|nr:AbiV family abortive infection protein [Cyanobacteria bacterium REEB65]
MKRETRTVSITKETLLAGAHLAVDQAKRLAEDARILEAAGSPSTAFALALLALEESGKAVILRNCSLNEASRAALGKDFKSHVAKVRAALNFYSLVRPY